MRVLGVDGCRGGWLVARTDVADHVAVTWSWFRSIREIAITLADAVAIDIPIGLPGSGRRACDVAARAMVGPRRSSVFPAPMRCVLGATTYADARALLAARGGPSMSAQAFGIVRAVADVDAVMAPALEDRVIEAHPEGVFAALAGAMPPKRSVEGAAARTSALQSAYGERLDVAALVSERPRIAGVDDALDALACAWTAELWLSGETVSLGDGSRDERGLLMRIVVPGRAPMNVPLPLL